MTRSVACNMSQHLHLHLLLTCHIFCQTKVKNDKTWFPDTPIAKIKYWRSLPADNIQLGDDVYFECEVTTCRNRRQQQNTYIQIIFILTFDRCLRIPPSTTSPGGTTASGCPKTWKPASSLGTRLSSCKRSPLHHHHGFISSSQLIFIYDIDIKCNQYNTDYRYIFNWASP